jgi:hypothetical protein
MVTAIILALLAVLAPQVDLQRAHELVIHWQQIVYPKFEDARAFISEENTDILNAFMSGGAVTSIRDRKTTAADVKKADEAITRFVNAMISAAPRQPDGSRIIDANAYQAAGEMTCPLYPFCTE